MPWLPVLHLLLLLPLLSGHLFTSYDLVACVCLCVQLAKLIVNSGGAAALVDYVRDTKGNVRLPGIMALGFISAFSETLALAVIVARGVPALKDALINEPEDHLKAATVWTLGQIGRHTPDHAKAIAEGGVLQPMVLLHVRDDSSAGACCVCTNACDDCLVICALMF